MLVGDVDAHDILNMLNEKSIGYSFLLNIHNEFHQHSSHLIVYFFNNQHAYQLFLHGIDENTSIVHMELGCIGHECTCCQLFIHKIVLVHALQNQWTYTWLKLHDPQHWT
jgi:hypothetical protein